MELWRPVRNYKGLYSVSDRGRVKSKPRTVPHRHIMMKLPGRVLSQWDHKNGYPYVTLSKNGKESHYPVHTLVVEAFHGRRPEGMEVRHWPDRDKYNNHASNLRWGTPKQNRRDMVRHGTSTKGQSFYNPPRGETHPHAKLSAKTIEAIRCRLQTPYRGLGRELARKYGVSEATICDIKMGRTRRTG